MFNAKLRILMSFAQQHGIDLDKAKISLEEFRPHSYEKKLKAHDVKVTFQHSRETAANMRNLKRAVGGSPL